MATIIGAAIALIQIYLFLIVIRIILGWTGLRHEGVTFLNNIVDPYLNLFRGLSFLRTKQMDFSPLAAFLVLNLLVYILMYFRIGSIPTVGGIAYFILGMIWSFISFMLGLFIILSLARLLGFAFPAFRNAPIWHFIDQLLMPPVSRIGMILRKGFLTYRTGLIIFALLGILIYFGGEFGFRLLSRVLY